MRRSQNHEKYRDIMKEKRMQSFTVTEVLHQNYCADQFLSALSLIKSS